MSSERRCFKITIEEVHMSELEQGDLFVLLDPPDVEPRYEKGTAVNRATSGASVDGSNGLVTISTDSNPRVRLNHCITTLMME